MPTPLIESILDDVVTQCKTIDTDSDYYNTVLTVERISKSAFSRVNFPGIAVGCISESKSEGNFGQTFSTAEILVVVTDRVQIGSDGDEALSKLAADVEMAVMADHTRGGIAINTHVTKIDRDWPLDRADNLWLVSLTFQVDFRHSRTDPSTAV